MDTLTVYNIEGKQVDTLKLDPAVFDGEVNTSVLHQAINSFRANQRTGLASTKTMGEVSGGGRKPWKQKGTGRARVGSTRSPLWRHGGVIFGPHPRDFGFAVPKKIRILALKSSLNAKLKENGIIALDEFKCPGEKTKEAAKIFSNLNVVSKKPGKNESVLLLLDKNDAKTQLCLRNIGYLTVGLANSANAYEILAHKKIVATKEAIKQLATRIKK